MHDHHRQASGGAMKLLSCAALLLLTTWAAAMDTVTVFATVPTAYEVGLIPGQFTFFRSGTVGAVTITYSVTGSAIAGTRYLGLTGAVTIPDGASFATVAVTPLAENNIEGGQNVLVSIDSSPNYIVGTPFAAEVIIDDKDLTAQTGIGQLVAAKPGVVTTGGTFQPSPFNTAVIRVDFNSTAVNRGGYVHFGGTAVVGQDYKVRYMIGHDTSTSTGNLFDIGRRSYNGSVVNGTDVFDINNPALKGYSKGEGNVANPIQLQCGSNVHNTQGLYEVGDQFTIAGDPTIYTIESVTAPSGPKASDTQTVTISPSLQGQVINGTQVSTTIDVTLSATVPRPFMFIPGGFGYNHIEWEIVPQPNSAVTGALTATMTLESSDDYALLNPTVATTYIAENNVILSAALGANAVRGGAQGLVTITSTSVFPRDITIPFTTSGTAAAGVDYTFPNMATVGASAYGTVVLAAGQTSVSVPITALASGATGNQTVTLTLLNSLDYSLQGSSNSSLNPSATVNINDSTTPIITPGTTNGGTTGSGTSSGTGGTTAAVRPLPTNSGSNSCGLGSGLGIIGLSLAMLARTGRRRRI